MLIDINPEYIYEPKNEHNASPLISTVYSRLARTFFMTLMSSLAQICMS